MNHQLLKEVLQGTALGLVVFIGVAVLSLPLPLLVFAPFLSGLVIGKTKRGLLSGFLTALIPILIVFAVLVGGLMSYDPSSGLPSTISLSGNPFGAIAQVISVAVVGSVVVGTGALFLIVAVVLVVVGSIIALLASSGLGALGGFIGGKTIRKSRQKSLSVT